LINDERQGWRLRIGEISTELLAMNYDSPQYNEWQEDIEEQGAIWGFHWRIDF